jgi:hypothetical protein
VQPSWFKLDSNFFLFRLLPSCPHIRVRFLPSAAHFFFFSIPARPPLAPGSSSTEEQYFSLPLDTVFDAHIAFHLLRQLVWVLFPKRRRSLPALTADEIEIGANGRAEWIWIAATGPAGLWLFFPDEMLDWGMCDNWSYSLIYLIITVSAKR